MNKKVANNIRLGIFITLGLLLFIGGIYFIGSRKNLFSSNTTVTAKFKNVGGLQEGNNVRFSGINVGTVEGITIISHNEVEVRLVIEKGVSKFIKNDAVAVIGGEGLMGDKVINLSAGSPNAASIKEGDRIQTMEPVSMEDLMATFQQTGEKAKTLISNLAAISTRISQGEGSLGKLYKDDVMYSKLNSILNSFDNSAKNAESLTADFASISTKVKRGEGSVGKFLVDESLYDGVSGMLDTLRVVSGNAIDATDKMVLFSEQLTNSEGTVGRLLTDTAMASNINQTITNLNEVATEVETTTEKINNSWFVNFLLGSKKKKLSN